MFLLLPGKRESSLDFWSARYLFHAGFLLGLHLDMEATCSSEMSVDFQRTTICHTPEGRTLQDHRCENLKSYISIIVHEILGRNEEASFLKDYEDRK
jgi:hypothetical protein